MSMLTCKGTYVCVCVYIYIYTHTHALLYRVIKKNVSTFIGVPLHFDFKQFLYDPYLIMLSVKQGGIRYYFLSLWYGLTWD